MKNKVFALLLTFSLAAMSLAGDVQSPQPDSLYKDPAQPLEGWTSKCRVVYVVDGDTVDVEVRRIIRIRLKDCWAPESRTTNKAEKKKGIAAKNHLIEFAEDKDGVVFIPASSRERLADILTFNRLVGYVYVDTKSIGEQQRKAGHATATKHQQ